MDGPSRGAPCRAGLLETAVLWLPRPHTWPLTEGVRLSRHLCDFQTFLLTVIYLWSYHSVLVP